MKKFVINSIGIANVVALFLVFVVGVYKVEGISDIELFLYTNWISFMVSTPIAMAIEWRN